MSDDMRNTKNLKAVIKKCFSTIVDVRDQRIDLNEMMQDARDDMKEIGIKPIRRKLRQRENRRSHREMLEYVAVLERRLRQTNPMDGLTCRRIAKEIHDMRAVLSGLGEMA